VKLAGGLLTGAVLLMLPAGRARADTPTAESAAEALFEQARDDIRRGAYAEAYNKLTDSQHLDPSNGTLLNIVLCEEKLGKLAGAWRHARELVERLPDGDDRAHIAQAKLAELSHRVPRLTVRLAPAKRATAIVMLDDVPLDPSSLDVPTPVDPGVHRLIVVIDGRAQSESRIAIDEGRQIEWVVEPEPSPVKMQVAPPPTPFAEPNTTPTWPRWVAVGAGAAGLVAGGLLGAFALDRRAQVLSACPAKQCPNAAALGVAAQGQALFVGSMTALGLGAVGLGAGGYLWLRETSGRGSSPRVPDAGRTAVVTYSGSF
jgi:hypothetical protein